MTRSAGIILAALGAIHLVVTSAMNWPMITDWISGGWWAAGPGLGDTDRLGEHWVAWLTVGSFGLPLLTLGLFIAHQRTAPKFVGWLVGVWALLLATLLPLTPAWLALIPAAMIVRARSGSPSPAR